MNTLGQKYIEDIKEKSKDIKFPDFTQSQVIERVMRLGREVKIFDLENNEYETFAILTLKEDYLNKITK